MSKQTQILKILEKNARATTDNSSISSALVWGASKLTEIDIKKMKEELEYRITKVRPAILEEVKFTRSFGDLSENAEYKEAKREKRKNEEYLRSLVCFYALYALVIWGCITVHPQRVQRRSSPLL